jgi:hypothetical protein
MRQDLVFFVRECNVLYKNYRKEKTRKVDNPRLSKTEQKEQNKKRGSFQPPLKMLNKSVFINGASYFLIFSFHRSFS